jgi:hypothetical protein
MMKWTVLFLLLPIIRCQENLEIVSKTRTSYLQEYGGYVDVVVMHVEIPKEVSFASLKFSADETQASMFGEYPDAKILVALTNVEF